MSEALFTPRPGAALLPRRIVAQTAMELRLQLRNGEQLLLTMAIPVLLLIFFAVAPVLPAGRDRVSFVLPGVIALAVMSTAFTGQAIATAFDRRHGVLKRLGATPLGRSGLIVAKTLAILGIETIQIAVLVVVGAVLGWHPRGSAGAAVLLVLVGTAAFSGLGLLMAGLLRAEATLGAANLVYLVLLVLGGVVFPISILPGDLRQVVSFLPITALTGGLRSALQPHATLAGRDLLQLVAWAVAAIGAASVTFRWD